jgi:hypothetical protein
LSFYYFIIVFFLTLFFWIEGKEDSAWTGYVKEVDDWLYSTDANKGQALFRDVEAKIMAEIGGILQQRKSARRRRRLLVEQHYRHLEDFTQALAQVVSGGTGTYSDGAASGAGGAHDEEEEEEAEDSSHSGIGSGLDGLQNQWRRQLQHHKVISKSTYEYNITQIKVDLEHEKEQYFGTEDQADRVYVYLAADNERVKEAFAEYLLGHNNISVMRVRTEGIIVHGKNQGMYCSAKLAASCYFTTCTDFRALAVTPSYNYRLFKRK